MRGKRCQLDQRGFKEGRIIEWNRRVNWENSGNHNFIDLFYMDRLFSLTWGLPVRHLIYCR
jgi:hypothetical protein